MFCISARIEKENEINIKMHLFVQRTQKTAMNCMPWWLTDANEFCLYKIYQIVIFCIRLVVTESYVLPCAKKSL